MDSADLTDSRNGKDVSIVMNTFIIEEKELNERRKAKEVNRKIEGSIPKLDCYNHLKGIYMKAITSLEDTNKNALDSLEETKNEEIASLKKANKENEETIQKLESDLALEKQIVTSRDLELVNKENIIDQQKKKCEDAHRTNVTGK